MSAVWVIKNLFGSLLLPPANGLVLLFFAGLFHRRRWALPLAVVGFVVLLAQSLGPVAHLLVAPLEARGGPVFSAPDGAQAIVILGSGRQLDAPEYGGDTVSPLMLVRVRYGALLARRHHLPVLVSGGMPGGGSRSEAEIMAGVLEQEFAVAVRWREDQSLDTDENARLSAKLLRAAGVRRVALVTHAFGMVRARRAFERAGIEVVPAPTAFIAGEGIDWSPVMLLPQLTSLRTSHWALHEWIGIAWYEAAAVWRELLAGASPRAGVSSAFDYRHRTSHG